MKKYTFLLSTLLVALHSTHASFATRILNAGRSAIAATAARVSLRTAPIATHAMRTPLHTTVHTPQSFSYLKAKTASPLLVTQRNFSSTTPTKGDLEDGEKHFRNFQKSIDSLSLTLEKLLKTYSTPILNNTYSFTTLFSHFIDEYISYVKQGEPKDKKENLQQMFKDIEKLMKNTQQLIMADLTKPESVIAGSVFYNEDLINGMNLLRKNLFTEQKPTTSKFVTYEEMKSILKQITLQLSTNMSQSLRKSSLAPSLYYILTILEELLELTEKGEALEREDAYSIEIETIKNTMKELIQQIKPTIKAIQKTITENKNIEVEEDPAIVEIANKIIIFYSVLENVERTLNN